ncbi:hypothetical protein KSP39_PZI021826 [Platanthera zijinensis]|uniref:Uncharacterized protein n=1 Tax=Platanthera zijinensis TaxID=2320716 RepID=A0AAP0AY43_9ASPA
MVPRGFRCCFECPAAKNQVPSLVPGGCREMEWGGGGTWILTCEDSYAIDTKSGTAMEYASYEEFVSSHPWGSNIQSGNNPSCSIIVAVSNMIRISYLLGEGKNRSSCLHVEGELKSHAVPKYSKWSANKKTVARTVCDDDSIKLLIITRTTNFLCAARIYEHGAHRKFVSSIKQKHKLMDGADTLCAPCSICEQRKRKFVLDGVPPKFNQTEPRGAKHSCRKRHTSVTGPGTTSSCGTRTCALCERACVPSATAVGRRRPPLATAGHCRPSGTLPGLPRLPGGHVRHFIKIDDPGDPNEATSLTS